MSRDVELEGEKIGKRVAVRYLKEISEAKGVEDLGRLAGAAMLGLVAQEEFCKRHPLCSTASWRRGFFEGFLARCDDLRG